MAANPQLDEWVVHNLNRGHDGDQRLARHVASAVLRTDSRGARIVKESKHSKRRIDLAVAAVMAHSRAVELARRPAPSVYVG